MGDPKGIGPEVLAKAWRKLSEQERAQFVIYGDHTTLTATEELVGVKFDHKQIVTTSSTPPPVQKIDDAEAARLAISAIDAAIADAKTGKIVGLVTAPVNKRRMQELRPNFLGHTEYLAKASHIKDAVMMFASSDEPQVSKSSAIGKQLCISLVTMHIPLKDVHSAITTERVLSTIRHTALALDRYFACPDARIVVFSLNPHVGEGGSLGNEEKTAIVPAITLAMKEGINCIGPVAADSVFRKLGDYDADAIVAMYHDQGLLPIKVLCQSHSVNITLGLPYIRTSPSHGTAEDIAWLGTADETSMLDALRLTRKLVGWAV